MREILFRGRRKGGGEWVEGCFVNVKLAHYLEREPLITTIDTGYSYEVDIDTVGQYTGLLDKNGKKIFEGDIVMQHVIPMVVKWDKESASFVVGYTITGRYYENTLHGNEMLEIVGNIHTNPMMVNK